MCPEDGRDFDPEHTVGNVLRPRKRLMVNF
jgi:hypothetical protein